MASFLRSNILRRGGDTPSSAEQSPNPEEPRQPQQQSEIEEQSQNQEERSRGSFPFSRRFMPALFTGRPRQEDPPPARDDDYNNDDEPKTPRLDQAPTTTTTTTTSSTRLHLPRIARPWTRGSSRNPPPPPSSSTTTADDDTRDPRAPPALSLTPSSRRSSVSVDTAQYPGLATPPAVAALRSSGGSSGRRRFDGPDPAELHLAALADSGRSRRYRHQHRRTHSGGSGSHSSQRVRRPEGDELRRTRSSGSGSGSGRDGSGEPPRRFLFCFPWVQSRRLRSQILKCFVSGLFMVAMLSVYLALSMTHRIGTSTFTIMLILMILFATIIFCHGLVRICMILTGRDPPRPEGRNGSDRDRDAERGGIYPYHRDMAQVLGPGGYAVPRRPIRVVLARDEEVAGLEPAAAGKLEPPAYGVWRESVRIDPNRFFWQRNDQAGAAPSSSYSSSHSSSSHSDTSSESSSGGGGGAGSRPGSAGSARPPSYASDDGVSYVVEARPRSIAPPLSEISASAGGGGGAAAGGSGSSSSSYLGGSSTASAPSDAGGRAGSAGTLWPGHAAAVRGEGR